jgi:hypothetical protein
MVVIFLDLAMKPTDTFVIQLDRIAFLATDSHGGLEVRVDSSSIRALDDTERQFAHFYLATST